MEQVQLTINGMDCNVGVSDSVSVNTSVSDTSDGLRLVVAYSTFIHEGEHKEARCAKSFGLGQYYAGDEVITRALKREALRELVTQLELMGVL